MKPILDKFKSKIINFGDSGLDLRLPKSAVGDLERIRFDGEKLVDIINLTEFYVTHTKGIFELHVRNDIDESQLIEMTFFDKNRLIVEGETIRLRTTQEIEEIKRAESIRDIKRLLKYKMDMQMGGVIDLFLFTHKLLYVLIKGLRTQNPQILNFIDVYLNEMEKFVNIADPDFKEELISEYKIFRDLAKEHLTALNSITGS